MQTHPCGLSAATDTTLLHEISTISLDQWPSWYGAQYGALIEAPQLQADILNSDENRPARVWREGRAKSAKVTLYPNKKPGNRVSKPNSQSA